MRGRALEELETRLSKPGSGEGPETAGTATAAAGDLAGDKTSDGSVPIALAAAPTNLRVHCHHGEDIEDVAL